MQDKSPCTRLLIRIILFPDTVLSHLSMRSSQLYGKYPKCCPAEFPGGPVGGRNDGAEAGQAAAAIAAAPCSAIHTGAYICYYSKCCSSRFASAAPLPFSRLVHTERNSGKVRVLCLYFSDRESLGMG